MEKVLSLLDLTPAERRPMTEDETKMLMSVILVSVKKGDTVGVDDDDDFWTIGGDKNTVTGLIFNIVFTRLQAAKVKATESVYMAIMVWETHSVGDLVLWAYTILQIARKNKSNVVNLTDLIEEFPMGIPTKAGKDRIWRSQKREDCPNHNYYDTAEAWAPLEEVAA
jgi:hypothetical protein